MESTNICERCKIVTNLSLLFSCNHSLCSHCIIKIFAFSHIRSILTQDQIQIACSCKLGTKIFTVLDIPQLLTKSNELSTCKMHGLTAKFCEVWLCDNCIEIHKSKNSDHQLTARNIDLKKCDINECQECKKYENELRTQIPACDVSVQLNKIEEITGNFRRQVDCQFTKTRKKMNEQIQFWEERKFIYIEKKKQIIQRSKLLLNLLNFCCLDFSSSQTKEDIHLLEVLSTLSIEYPIFKGEIQQKIANIHEYFTKCLEMTPVDIIKINWILRDWSNNTLTLIGHNRAVRSLIQLKDGRIASGSDDMTIKIWEVKGKEFKNTMILTGHNGCVCTLVELKEGKIASGSDDNTIKVWEENEKNFQNTLTLIGHTCGVLSIIGLKDGKIASGSCDNTIKVWFTREHVFKNTLNLIGHKSSVWSLLELTDGRIVSGSEDYTIKIWREWKYAFKNTLTLNGHNEAVRTVIQLKDGRIISGSQDYTIKVWEVEETVFKNTLTLTGHKNWIRTLIQLKDGRIASGSRDRTIRVWEVKEREFKNTLTLTKCDGSIWSLIQLKDGRIASGSDENTINVIE